MSPCRGNRRAEKAAADPRPNNAKNKLDQLSNVLPWEEGGGGGGGGSERALRDGHCVLVAPAKSRMLSRPARTRLSSPARLPRARTAGRVRQRGRPHSGRYYSVSPQSRPYPLLRTCTECSVLHRAHSVIVQLLWTLRSRQTPSHRGTVRRGATGKQTIIISECSCFDDEATGNRRQYGPGRAEPSASEWHWANARQRLASQGRSSYLWRPATAMHIGFEVASLTRLQLERHRPEGGQPPRAWGEPPCGRPREAYLARTGHADHGPVSIPLPS